MLPEACIGAHLVCTCSGYGGECRFVTLELANEVCSK